VEFIGGLAIDKVGEREAERFAFAAQSRKKGEKENFE